MAKPVVYGHFGTREGLLAALYEDFDARQTAVMDAALGQPPCPGGQAAVIASCYVDCVLTQGREIPGILAALAGSPILERIKRDYQLVFSFAKCRAFFGPFTRSSGLAPASFWAMLGAADALSSAAAQASR